MDDRDAKLLRDMQTHARYAVEFVAGRTYDEFVADARLRFAVERVVEIIGEAARGLSESLTAAHPQIPWRAIVVQRHILAHGYSELDPSRIWRVATHYAPELIRLLEPISPPLPPEPEEPHP